MCFKDVQMKHLAMSIIKIMNSSVKVLPALAHRMMCERSVLLQKLLSVKQHGFQKGTIIYML